MKLVLIILGITLGIFMLLFIYSALVLAKRSDEWMEREYFK